MDTLPFYLFLFAHIVSLITGFGSVIVIDAFGMMALRGKVQISFLNKVAETTQRLIWLGWAGLVCSGIGLITIKGYVDNLTKIKLFFVLMLGINGIVLHFIKKSMERLGQIESMSQVPASLKFRVGFASAVSQLGWWGALTIGFVHRHWRHNIPWPSNPWLIIALLAVGITAIGLIGYAITKKRNV